MWIQYEIEQEIEKIRKTINKSLKIARPVSAYAFFNGRLFKTDTIEIEQHFSSLRNAQIRSIASSSKIPCLPYVTANMLKSTCIIVISTKNK